jgi:hypothetical protein
VRCQCQWLAGSRQATQPCRVVTQPSQAKGQAKPSIDEPETRGPTDMTRAAKTDQARPSRALSRFVAAHRWRDVGGWMLLAPLHHDSPSPSPSPLELPRSGGGCPAALRLCSGNQSSATRLTTEPPPTSTPRPLSPRISGRSSPVWLAGWLAAQ